ncbi:hypothetical protein BGW39_007121 [Mortierella sp. 14UC]|nr:hypothetical protein BGW39_007121 [Mortierella sp. 14UC]
MDDNHQQEEYQYLSHNVYPIQQQPQQATEPQINNNSKDLHKRRMSLDVFKAPFNLSKTRRATCAASDLKRMLTIKTPSALVRRYHGNEDHHGSNNVEFSGTGGGGHEGGDGGSADEILKTSRYHPDDQFMDSHAHEYQQQQEQQKQFQDTREGYALNDDQDIYQYQHQAAEGPYNPFVQHHHNIRAGHGHYMGIHPFDSAPAQQETDPYCQQQSFQSPSRPEQQKPANPARRRCSVFSDWSIEDCPRLLAMQQRQQQEQQREEQGYQDMSASQVLLSRSMTDTSLGQNYDITQQPLHTTTTTTAHSYHSSPVSPSPASEPAATAGNTERPRRNTVILGKNLIRSATAAASTRRRFNPETSSLKSTNSLHHHHHHHHTTDAYAASLQHRQQQQQQQEHEHGHKHGHGQQQSRRPAGRPESSHSYKHDFLKDTVRWKPHPWTAASSSYSYPSASSSPSSPLHQSQFPHELVDDDDDEGEKDGDGDGDGDSSSDDSADSGEDEYGGYRAVVKEDDRSKDQGGSCRQHESHRRHSTHSRSHNQHSDRHRRRHSYVQEQGLWQERNRQSRSEDSNDAHSNRSFPATMTTSRQPKPEPLYHNMKAIQMRPYGHEDDDDDQDEHENGQCYYDESSEWQRQYSQRGHDSALGYYESSMSYPSSAASFPGCAASTTTPTKARSQDSLAKKASLAKAKFYKYFNHTKSSASSSSFTSSLRARVRLTKTKTVLRQVKRRLSEALSEATTKAASTLKHDLHLGKKGGPVTGGDGGGDALTVVVDHEQHGHGYREAVCQQAVQWQDQSHQQTYR